MTAPLLEVSGLTVRHRRDLIVDGVDLTLARGEALGLAGESGCGKSTTALSLMRLLPAALEQEGAIVLHAQVADLEQRAHPCSLSRGLTYSSNR